MRSLRHLRSLLDEARAADRARKSVLEEAGPEQQCRPDERRAPQGRRSLEDLVRSPRRAEGSRAARGDALGVVDRASPQPPAGAFRAVSGQGTLAEGPAATALAAHAERARGRRAIPRPAGVRLPGSCVRAVRRVRQPRDRHRRVLTRSAHPDRARADRARRSQGRAVRVVPAQRVHPEDGGDGSLTRSPGGMAGAERAIPDRSRSIATTATCCAKSRSTARRRVSVPTATSTSCRMTPTGPCPASTEPGRTGMPRRSTGAGEGARRSRSCGRRRSPSSCRP